jgi:hypothetical protein
LAGGVQFNRAAVDEAFGAGGQMDEDGIEDAFELVAEVPEKVRWVAMASVPDPVQLV